MVGAAVGLPLGAIVGATLTVGAMVGAEVGVVDGAGLTDGTLDGLELGGMVGTALKVGAVVVGAASPTMAAMVCCHSTVDASHKHATPGCGRGRRGSKS